METSDHQIWFTYILLPVYLWIVEDFYGYILFIVRIEYIYRSTENRVLSFVWYFRINIWN